MNKIGILGGTFNPIHHGHLIIAEQIRLKFNLHKIVFVPSGIPPHKDTKKVISSVHRLNMLKLATATNNYFEVSEVELKRSGYSYTIDTLNFFKKKYGNSIEFYYIIGSDNLYDIINWKDFEQLLLKYNFIVAKRVEHDNISILNRIDMLKENYLAKIYIAEDMPLIQISSTDLRKRISDSKTIKYLVPESVEQYITENVLYK